LRGSAGLPQKAGIVDHFETYLRERLAAYPALTAVRLWREFKERGFARGCSVARDRVRERRPSRPAGFEVRFETPAGKRAQVEFATFEAAFIDEPGVNGIVWLLSMVLSYSRLIWARFVEIAHRGDRLFSPGSEASSNGSQYACRRVDDGYGLLSLALPQWIFRTLIG